MFVMDEKFLGNEKKFYVFKKLKELLDGTAATSLFPSIITDINFITEELLSWQILCFLTKQDLFRSLYICD